MTAETNKPNLTKLTFDVTIAATPAKIWQILWSDPSYRQWTRVFSPGSYAVTDWKKGSKVQFLSPKGEGMYAIIAEHEEHKRITFKHLGEVKDFKEQPESAWSGSEESYLLTEENGAVKLTVTMDSTPEFETYFNETMPKAIAIVKELAEKPYVLTIEAVVNAPLEKVWKLWTTPEAICQWNNASDEWHTTRAENDLRAGGKFTSRMEAKDGSAGFDFEGIYNEVKTNETIAYTMSDGRQTKTTFTDLSGAVKVVTSFEAETVYPLQFQVQGWQAILNSFKNYAEAN